MNSILVPSSFIFRSPSLPATPFHHLHTQHIFTGRANSIPCRISTISYPSNSLSSLRACQSSVDAKVPSDEGPVSVINFEDFVEKDWSFLDSDELSSSEEHNQKIARIISTGEIGENSRVLVSTGSEGFVDQLIDTSPCSFLLVVHDSLFLLAIIKEKYDKVKCWQGELIYVPEKWDPLDVVFLYFLPALPFKLDQVVATLAKRCSPGARVVISHPQGREMLEQQKKEYQDVVVSDLPDKVTLEKVAADHAFEMTQFVDDPGFYLAVLRFCGSRS